MAHIKSLRSCEGGSVIFTISVLLVLVAISGSMLGLFSTSIMETVNVNSGSRAEYLAQAGYRYAAGEYKHAGDSITGEWDQLKARVDRLATLNGETVRLKDSSGNSQGEFEINIYPYWFRVDADHAASTDPVTIEASAPGELAPGYQFPASGRVRIGSYFKDYTSGVKKDSKTVSFQVDNIPKTLKGEWVCLSFQPSETQTASENGDIVFTSLNYGSYKSVFPARNGQFEVDGDTYFYRERKEGSVKLSGITTDGGKMPLVINADRDLVINQQVEIICTGTTASGLFPSERQLVFNVPITSETFNPAGVSENLDLSHPDEASPQADHDTFFNLDHWDQSQEELDKNIRDRKARPGNNESGANLNTSTRFGSHDDYVTFQNFDTFDPEADYSAVLMDHGLTTNTLRGVWGTAADNVYVVGDGGVLLHYDGEGWTSTKPLGWTGDLNAIWGVSKDRFVVAGDRGKVMAYQYGSWRNCPQSDNYDLFGLWGTAWNHFDAYGNNGSNPYNWGSYSPQNGLKNYYYYRNNYWGINFKCLWAVHASYGGRSDQNILCGERSVKTNYWDGNRWRYGWVKGFIFHEFFPEPVYFLKKLSGVWGSSFKNVYTVGEDGSMWKNTSGKINKSKKWKAQSSIPTTEDLNGIYGIGEDYIYAVGDNGTIIFNDGSGWVNVPTDKLDGVGDLHSVWASGSTGLYAVGDNGKVISLGYPENDIAYYILPLKKNAAFKSKWESSGSGRYLSYAVQAKQVWGSNLNYAASGICFRWHESSSGSGKYEGYGLSFMRYKAFSTGSNDFIPDSMKPAYRDTNSKNDRPLIVLWKQYVENGNEKRIWLAYKDLSDDSKLVDGNKIFEDLSTIMVRIDEKRINGSKVNDINVYYGNSSTTSQSGDTNGENTNRLRYNPTFVKPKWRGTIEWPDFEDFTCRANTDYFTLVSNVSVASSPVGAACRDVTDPATGVSVYKCENYWIINPSPAVTGVQLLNDKHTIRSGTFTSPEKSDGFGTQDERCEVALHVFGGVGKSSQTSKLAGFADVAVQLESNTGGSSSPGGFGRLR